MDENKFRALMAKVPAPVTVVTTMLDGKPVGATVSSFASLFLRPSLITIALMNDSRLLSAIEHMNVFAVNLLSVRQEEIALRFASRSEDRFAQTSWVEQGALPKIVLASAFTACSVFNIIEGGDHKLIFGLVNDCVQTDEPPLVYSDRLFGTHSEFVARSGDTIQDGLRACAN